MAGPNNGEHGAATTPPRSRLLDLPTEVQLQIYELVLTHPKPINIYLDRCRAERLLRVQPPLSKVSREIRQDVLQLYYSHITFSMCCFSGKAQYLKLFRAWLSAIGSANRARLANVYLFSDYAYYRELGDGHKVKVVENITRALDGLVTGVLETEKWAEDRSFESGSRYRLIFPNTDQE